MPLASVASNDHAQPILEGLNAAQLAAVTHGDGPALVVAGAGSGKTRVLTRRIAYLIAERHIRPHQILAITFTNKAADEMRERVVTQVGSIAREMAISTFHRAGVRILRRNAHLLNYPNRFTIYDKSDSASLIRDVIGDLGYDTKLVSYRMMLDRISRCKNFLETPADIAARAEGRLEEAFSRVYDLYQTRLKEAGAMDFDDLLGLAVTLFRKHGDILEQYQNNFLHILVDEYQDTNVAQNELVHQLGRAHRNVFVVGDSDQSIYAFRGADPGNIVRFDTAFGQDCSTYVLEQNYRSTQVVLNAANALISNNPQLVPKNLWTDSASGPPLTTYRADNAEDEAGFVALEIQRLLGSETPTGQSLQLSDIAVFYRSNAQSRIIEEALIADNLPYKVVGGTRFYDRREIRDALGFLKAAVNPADTIALKRVLNLPSRGIGKTSLEKVSTHAHVNHITFSEALRQARGAGVKNKPLAGITAFVELHDKLIATVPEGPDALIQLALTESGYLASLEAEDTEDARVRLENLEELLVSAASYQTCDEFIDQVALVNDTDDLPDGGEVSLMTLHSSKGLEYPVVFFTGLEEHLCPHVKSMFEPDDLEEERRLVYVGITRAQQRLYLTHALSRVTHGSTNYNTPSRFLDEILCGLDTDQVDDRSERIIGSGRSFLSSLDYRT